VSVVPALDRLTALATQIRTSMNGVVGLTSLLLETPLTVEQREYSEGVVESAEALLAFLSDVVDLSRIEAGTLAIDPFEFELKTMVNGALAPLAAKARDKGLTIDVRCHAPVPESVIGDPARLGQVLSNLVDNAIKFSARGVITVEIATVSTPGSPTQIRFSVTDSGIGIAAERLPAIFENFIQSDVTTRRFGTSGLGLGICRQLVDLMRGQLSVESTPGSGSTFSFIVPLATAHSATTSAVEEPSSTATTPMPPLHVLVVEDNKINQTVAVKWLHKAGCTTEVVENGEQAVRRVAERHFDLVLMDCQMPVMDGYEATRRIRECPEHAQMAIVAITASAIDGDRERCLALGMNDYLSKPLQPASLIAILDEIRRSRGETCAPAILLDSSWRVDAA
jgi:CheY-like chemotaxis protein/anti-sigma regulatory factor (Ser/Thr protein kinase)